MDNIIITVDFVSTLANQENIFASDNDAMFDAEYERVISECANWD